MFSREPAEFVSQILQHTQILLDTSSYLVLKDIGALTTASRTWKLSTIQEVHREIGWISVPVLIVPTESPGDTEQPVDQLLLNTAAATHLPLLSEDRRLLEAAETRDILCFDTLAAIELLHYLGNQNPSLIQPPVWDRLRRARSWWNSSSSSTEPAQPPHAATYAQWKQNILNRNRYRSDRLAWAEQLATYLTGLATKV
ncbi:MAG: hypothetical protein SNJ56_02640 [Termitinemataceae bacterium]